MPLSINWTTKVISIPQSYLTLITGTLYELDTDQFRLDLKDIEDSEEGLPFPDTHRHNTTVTVAGTTFARTIEIINGYSVEFEDGAYTVRLAGSNNNLFDVENGILVQNSVQVIAQNSAGLIVGAGANPQDVADAVWETPTSAFSDLATFGGQAAFQYLLAHHKVVTDPSTGKMTVYAVDGTTVLFQADLFQDAAGVTPYAGAGAERRERFT